METTITLIKESFELIRANLKLIGKTLGRVILGSLAWLAGVLVLGFLTYFLVAVVKITLLAVLVGILAVVFFFLGVIYIQAWVYLALALALINQDPLMTSKAISSKAWGMVNKYWWLMFLSMLVVLGAMSLLIIPGIVVGVAVSMCLYVFLEEGVGGMEGILKSRFYTKGFKLRLVGRYSLLLVIVGLVQMSLEELAKSQNLVLQITSSLLLIIFSIGWGTFLMAFTYRNFLWLKKQKLNKVFNPAEARGKYKALAIWGGVAIVAMIILPVVILTAINPGNQMAKSRDSFKKNTIQMIGRGAELYRTEKGVYPESIEQMIEGKYIRLNTDSNSSDLVYQSDGTTYEVCGQTELDGKYCYSPNNTFPLKQDVIE